MQHPMTRREFTKYSLHSLLTFSLIESLYQSDLFADEIKGETVKWLSQINQIGRDVKDQKMKQIAWQKKTEELFKRVELSDLLKFIDFDRLTAKIELIEKGAKSLRFKFRQLDGVPNKLVFGKQIFALKRRWCMNRLSQKYGIIQYLGTFHKGLNECLL